MNSNRRFIHSNVKLSQPE